MQPNQRPILFCLLLAGLGLLLLTGASRAGFLENWAQDTSPYFMMLTPGASQIHANQPDPAAQDGRVVQLQLAAGPTPGPGGGPELETTQLYRYGQYQARLKTANCQDQPLAGVVTGYFVYFNDGLDHNLNHLPDNSEIDFEWLCAEPEVIYLTAWTDYRDSDERHKRIGRKINLRTGRLEYSCYFESFGQCQPLSGPENQPEQVPALPAYDSSSAYYQYGLDWSANRLLFWVVDPATGQRLTLWDYQGPARRIPNLAAYYMVNVWHTPNWTPEGKPQAVQPPTQPLSIFVDWLSLEPRAYQSFLPLIP
jgi:hypothetical protein